jgi:hypothetical protein
MQQDGHVAAEQVALCWILDFNCTPFNRRKLANNIGGGAGQNLLRLSSFVNGRLRCLYSASSKSRFFIFFSLYHQNNRLENISIFYLSFFKSAAEKNYSYVGKHYRRISLSCMPKLRLCPFYIHIYLTMLNTQFRFAPDLPERNYCVSRGLSILNLKQRQIYC